jgi:4-amino-4-deoxy-L-arabinose transferase-like glycosyltransferase
MLDVSLRSERIHRAAVVVLAVILVFVALFWRLGTPTFWDPDEAHDAETSREMVATGDWWAPYYNEEPFFDKPVLFHPLQAASTLVFNDAELAARFAPALTKGPIALVLCGLTLPHRNRRLGRPSSPPGPTPLVHWSPDHPRADGAAVRLSVSSLWRGIH